MDQDVYIAAEVRNVWDEAEVILNATAPHGLDYYVMRMTVDALRRSNEAILGSAAEARRTLHLSRQTTAAGWAILNVARAKRTHRG